MIVPSSRAASLLFFACAPLAAQDFLEPLVVTTGRVDRAVDDVPYTVDYIDGSVFTAGGRRSLPEALEHVPGVLVQKTAYGHGSPFIRGFTGRRNLLLYDGVRVNNSTFRSGPVQYWNTFDPWGLDHVELVKSQGSVLYGSDAIGGTLNALSRAPDFRQRTDGEVYHGGMTRYEARTNGRGSHLGRIEADTGVGGNFGLLLGFSTREYGDIRDSSVGLMRGTGYPEQSWHARFDWAIHDNLDLTLAHNGIRQRGVSRWHRTANNPGWDTGRGATEPGTWTANDFDQDRTLTYLRLAGRDPRADAIISNWTALVSWQTSRESEFQNRLGDPSPGSRPIRGSTIDVETLGLDLTLESPAGPGRFIYGFDFYQDRVDADGYQTNPADTNRREVLPLADDSRYDLLGSFAQYEWQVNEKLEITGGARHTHAKATLGRFEDASGTIIRDQSRSWDATVGALRAIYKIDDCWSIYGGVSQAFRAPNLVDLSGNLTALSGAETTGATDLKSERFLTTELGVRRTGDTVSLGLAVFHTDGENLITTVPDAPGSSSRVTANASSAEAYGIELDGAWRFHPQWTLSGFAAWQDSRVDTQSFVGGPSSSAPASRQLPLTGSVALRWTDVADKIWIEGRLLAAAREDRFTAADQAADNQRIPTGGTPGYIVASIHGGYRVNDHLTFTAGLENLTDTDYRNHGSGQNNPGFNAILGATVRW